MKDPNQSVKNKARVGRGRPLKIDAHSPYIPMQDESQKRDVQLGYRVTGVEVAALKRAYHGLPEEGRIPISEFYGSVMMKGLASPPPSAPLLLGSAGNNPGENQVLLDQVHLLVQHIDLAHQVRTLDAVLRKSDIYKEFTSVNERHLHAYSELTAAVRTLASSHQALATAVQQSQTLLSSLVQRISTETQGKNTHH